MNPEDLKKRTKAFAIRIVQWMEILEGIGSVQTKELQSLKEEAHQLLAITVSSINTARKNNLKP
jgi:hypothetical protein